MARIWQVNCYEIRYLYLLMINKELHYNVLS